MFVLLENFIDESPWITGTLKISEVVVNWDAIGAIAEALGAAGVIVTLMRTTKASTYQEVYRDLRQNLDSGQ